jgi:drug/metabolite transporter (DMT)-like permease
VFWSQRVPLTSVSGLIVGFIGVVVFVFDSRCDSSLASNGKAISAGIIAVMSLVSRRILQPTRCLK